MSHQYVGCQHGLPVHNCVGCNGVDRGVSRVYQPQLQYVLNCPHCMCGVKLTMGPNPVPTLSRVGGGDRISGVNVPVLRDLRPVFGALYADESVPDHGRGSGLGVASGGAEQAGEHPQRYRLHVNTPHSTFRGDDCQVGEDGQAGIPIRAVQNNGNYHRYRSVSSEHVQEQGQIHRHRRSALGPGDSHEHSSRAPAQEGHGTVRHHATRHPRNPFSD